MMHLNNTREETSCSRNPIIIAIAALAIGGAAFAQGQMAPVAQTAGLQAHSAAEVRCAAGHP